MKSARPMNAKAVAWVAAMCLSVWLPGVVRSADTPRSRPGAPRAAEQFQQGRGTVEAVDLAAGTVTLRHDALEFLRLPGAITQFEVLHRSQLVGLKPGDRVEFDLQETGRGYRLTRIQPRR
jgi:Cu/Ag efflux protein CusF